ncbi:MAG: hypothetical protein HY744_10095 [Deltaproteobacteria bacterium]|nr:hypothetical protein [Deltaproteobacteria bacterium]
MDRPSYAAEQRRLERGPNLMVIVEVLSDSSEADGRGQKWARHRRISSRRDYVLVS